MPDEFSSRAFSPHASGSGQPLIWLLQGARLGDNEQVLALGAALAARFGWRLAVKQIRYRGAPPPRVPLAHALDHVDLAASDSITGAAAGPAPDLVISIGRRAAPVGRWLKAQARPAGIPAGIHVQLGRYQDDFRDVDLLVTTAQYGLPAAANMLHLTLPITARPKAVLAAAAAALEPALSGLPRPFVGVLVGGPSTPVGFTAEDGLRLLAEARAHARACGGSLLVATSPRTPAAVTDHFARNLAAPDCLFPFERGRHGPNPYPALLALCDSFIVTSDSISMLADAGLTGRPVHLFDLPVTPRRALWKPSWPGRWIARRRLQRRVTDRPADVIDRWFDARVQAGRAQPIRHVPILTRRLVREGLVSRLGAGPAAPAVSIPALADLAAQEREMVASRIAALLAEGRARHPAALLPVAGVGRLAVSGLAAAE